MAVYPYIRKLIFGYAAKMVLSKNVFVHFAEPVPPISFLMVIVIHTLEVSSW